MHIKSKKKRKRENQSTIFLSMHIKSKGDIAQILSDSSESDLIPGVSPGNAL
jgi:hypothetical protein